jgi:hypothetical protein
MQLPSTCSKMRPRLQSALYLPWLHIFVVPQQWDGRMDLPENIQRCPSANRARLGTNREAPNGVDRLSSRIRICSTMSLYTDNIPVPPQAVAHPLGGTALWGHAPPANAALVAHVFTS